MKKLVCIFLIVTLVCTVAACGGETGGGGGNAPAPTDSGSPGGGANTPAPPTGGGNTGTPASPTGGGGANTPAPPTGSGTTNTPAPPTESGTPGTPAPTDGGGNTPAPPAETGGGGNTPAPPTETGGGNTPTPPAETGGGGGSSGGLSGSPVDILAKLVDDITNAGVHMPMSLPPSEVAPDLSQNTIGLSEADFGRLVVSAAYNMAAIGTFAHQMIMIQANDDKAAVDVKKLVSGDGGYDAAKWICVFPEKAIAVESGSYVLIVASYAEVADAAVEAFRAAAGSIGDVNTFYEFA